MSTQETKDRKRKAAARAPEIILACLEERLSMVRDDVNVPRIEELLDELKRSLKKGTASEEAAQ